MRGLFVTGTDTDAGKTRVAAGLMQCHREAGLPVAGVKPVAAGCDPFPVDGPPRGVAPGGSPLRCNADALALAAEATVSLPYEQINPYRFDPPIAPHIAAAEAGVDVDPERIAAAVEAAVRAVGPGGGGVVAGAGGWLVPIDRHRTLADVALRLGLPVVVVVGLRLGCINHALLTVESIRHRGLPVAGGGAKGIDPAMARVEENVAALAERIDAPLLGVVPPLGAGESAAPYLRLPDAPVVSGSKESMNRCIRAW